MEHVGAMVFDNSKQAEYGGMHYNNYISCHKDRMFFHLNYFDTMTMEELVLLCV